MPRARLACRRTIAARVVCGNPPSRVKGKLGALSPMRVVWYGPPMAEWKRNLGEQPRATKGRRVFVELRNGMKPAESWPADGPSGCDWRRLGSEWDIVRYCVE